jgi:hypothetical protein
VRQPANNLQGTASVFKRQGSEILIMDWNLLEITSETKNRLERLKAYPEEPYDRVISRLMDSRENNVSLTREEVEEIREALRFLKEGRFPASGQAREEVGQGQVPGQENVSAFFAHDQPAPQSSIRDPRAVKDIEQAVKDMEMIFSGAEKRAHDQELTGPDQSDIHELDPYDKRRRAHTPHLDSL